MDDTKNCKDRQENSKVVDRNPIFIHEILEVIFQKADVPTLKAARRTCWLWNVVATPELARKSVTKVNKKLREEYQDIKFPISSLKFEHCFYPRYKILEKFSSTLTTLHIPITKDSRRFEDGWFLESFNWNFYRSILNCCPKVKTLSIEYMVGFFTNSESVESCPVSTDEQTQFLSIKELKISPSCHSLPIDISTKLLKAMPSLQAVVIAVKYQNYFDDIMNDLAKLRKEGYLQNLNRIELQVLNDEEIYISDRHLTNLIDMKLTSLKSIRLKAFNLKNVNRRDEKLSATLFYEFFTQCKNTLECFSLYNCRACHLPRLQFPVMESLTRLEIYLLHVPDWYRLLLSTNIIVQFPKLKVLSAFQKYGISEHRRARINYRNSYYLDLLTKSSNSENTDTQMIHRLEFDVHNLIESTSHITLFQEMRNLFPTMRVMRTTIKGYMNLYRLLKVMSNTHVEEMDVHVGCIKDRNNKNICCLEQPPEDPDSRVMAGLAILRWKKDIKPDLAVKFPDLQKLIITSEGCRKVNHKFMVREGVMSLLKDAAKLEDFQIKYQ